MDLCKPDLHIQLPGWFQAPRANTLAINKRIIKAVLRGTGLNRDAGIQRGDDHLIGGNLILRGHPFGQFSHQNLLRASRLR
jgi:hypothetical protein